jgi:hypothetical protein
MRAMLKKLALPVLFFLALTAVGRASATKPPGLTVKLSTDKTIYRAGEPVKITLTVTNKGRAAANLLFGSGQSYDINITGMNNKVVWHWSRNKVFTMAVRHVRLLPKQGQKYQSVWQQLDDSGQAVKPGKYFIRARLTSALQLASPKRTVIIK